MASPPSASTYELGAELAPAGLTMRLFANVAGCRPRGVNVIADSPYGDPENVILVGAHLD